MASYQYVYTMSHLTKTFPGGREVLKDVTLAFLPGAKIGVLGVNGAGKSTLMKLFAWELYNIANDRAEMHDLAKEHPERVSDMADRWEAWADRARVRPWPWTFESGE